MNKIVFIAEPADKTFKSYYEYKPNELKKEEKSDDADKNTEEKPD